LQPPPEGLFGIQGGATRRTTVAGDRGRISDLHYKKVGYSNKIGLKFHFRRKNINLNNKTRFSYPEAYCLGQWCFNMLGCLVPS